MNPTLLSSARSRILRCSQRRHARRSFRPSIHHSPSFSSLTEQLWPVESWTNKPYQPRTEEAPPQKEHLPSPLHHLPSFLTLRSYEETHLACSSRFCTVLPMATAQQMPAGPRSARLADDGKRQSGGGSSNHEISQLRCKELIANIILRCLSEYSCDRCTVRHAASTQAVDSGSSRCRFSAIQ